MNEMKVPSSSGKVSLRDLNDVRQVEYDGEELPDNEALALRVTEAGYKFDFLWRPDSSKKALFVFFSGDAIRSKNEPPVFQRWSWAPHFPGSCLFVSDPSLYRDKDLGLAWYAGTLDIDPLEAVARCIARICAQKGIPLENVYAYGSSGGGFAALRLLTFLDKVGAIAINAQTVVTNYQSRMVERYLRVCFDGLSRADVLQQFPERMSILHHAARLKGRRIIYIQNVLDAHHHDDHYKPLCAAMGCTAEDSDADAPFHRILFSHPDGHRKAEPADVVNRAMKIVKAHEKR